MSKPLNELIDFQTWICPKCSDDHPRHGECSPKNDKPFSPSPDDRSHIANEFRKIEARCAWQAEMLERAKSLLLNDNLRRHVVKDFGEAWLTDLEKGPQ